MIRGFSKNNNNDKLLIDCGIKYNWNIELKSLIINNRNNQESDILYIPRIICEKYCNAILIDFSGLKLISLDGFDCFTKCKTIIIDDNSLNEHSININGCNSPLR